MLVAGLTNQGMERARNEDSCFAVNDSNSALLVVADGMGGHRAGDVASQIAVSTAEKFWNQINDTAALNDEEARSVVKNIIIEANKQVLEEAGSFTEKRGMGTTLTVGLLYDRCLTVGHIGDSRAYLINDGQIQRLTSDHSLLEQLIQSGQVKPEEAKNHPKRHVLTRALGTSSEPEIDLFEKDIKPGSILVFCTDGLTSLVEDHEILTVASDKTDPQRQAESLIALANARGGFDNITVVIATGIGGTQA